MSTGAKIVIIYFIGWIIAGIVWGIKMSGTNSTAESYFDRHFGAILLTVVAWPAAALVLVLYVLMVLPAIIARAICDRLG